MGNVYLKVLEFFVQKGYEPCQFLCLSPFSLLLRSARWVVGQMRCSASWTSLPMTLHASGFHRAKAAPGKCRVVRIFKTL